MRRCLDATIGTPRAADDVGSRRARLLLMGAVPNFVDDVPDDVERFRAMSPTERLRLFFELCDLTDSVVNERPNAHRLREPTPRSRESIELWRRLMKC